MTHTELEELIAAYAIGALDSAETRAAEPALIDHIVSCASCRTLLVGLREVGGALALASDPVAVRGEVEERLMAAVRGEARPAIRSDERRTSRFARVALVAAVVAALGFGSFSVQLYRSRGDAQRQLRAVGAILNDPAARRADLCTGTARCQLAIVPDGNGVLLASDLPRLDQGRVFELWVLRGGTPSPAKVFGTSADQQLLLFKVAPGSYDAAAVTIERAPNGSQRPTGAMIFSSRITA